MMPISCMECRRRKIKCNKMVPCNQCTVKDRRCEYPAKFRSIKVEQLVVGEGDSETPETSGSNNNNNTTTTTIANTTTLTATVSPVLTAPTSMDESSKENAESAEPVAAELAIPSPPKQAKRGIKRPRIEETGPQLKSLESSGTLTLENTVPLLHKMNKENEALKLKIRELRLKNKRQRTKMKRLAAGQLEAEEASDEDAEEGGQAKFEKLEPTAQQSIYYGPNSTRYMITSSMTKDEALEFDDFIKVKRQIKQKRNLPVLVQPKANSAKARQIAQRDNMAAIVGLIKMFFHLKVHYMNFLSPDPLLELYEKYDSIKSWDKNDDGKLLLSIMIMIVTLRSLPASEPLLLRYGISYAKNKDSLYMQYKNLKRGIQLDTTDTLRADVLECEELFYCDEIEKSWSLLFQLVSSAYSLGLHVYDESIVKTLKAEQHEKSADVVKNNPKTSLWLIINFVSAAICSVLGRPNPVTFNFQPLLKNYEIRLNYKIALADLVKKSTSILIDSYKVPIDLATVLDIDETFVNEVLIYEKILIDTRIMRNMKSRDITKPSFITLPVIDRSQKSTANAATVDSDGTKYATANLGVQSTHWSGPKTNSLSQMNLSKLLSDCPLDIRFTILRPCPMQSEEAPWCLIMQDGDTLCDLIMLYGNRAKFHQHFMSKYTKSLESCLDSVLKVLEHTQDLVELLIKHFDEPCFQRVYPFFYVFLYQTFVVVYTMLHLDYTSLSPYYNEISMIRQRLIKLYETVGRPYWRPNVVRIIQCISDMCDAFFKAYLEKEQQIPKGTTLPRMPEVKKGFMVHPGAFQIQQERQEKERQAAAYASRAGSQPMVAASPMFQNSPSSDAGSQSHFAVFPDLQMQAVPEDIRRRMASQTAAYMPSPQPAAPLHQPPFGNGSLSQLSLTNLEYYNVNQPAYPSPFPQQQQQQQQSQSQQQQPQHHHHHPNNNNTSNMVDPLLGFDMNDPFFVQNPFNFTYAPPTSDSPSARSSDAAEFVQNGSATTNSNDVPDSCSPVSSKRT